MASEDKLLDLAQQAERDLNSYQAKTGANKQSSSDEAGVDTRVEKKFAGAEVKYDDDLSTNRGYNKRIPPQEGGETDSRGRYGSLFYFQLAALISPLPASKWVATQITGQLPDQQQY